MVTASPDNSLQFNGVDFGLRVKKCEKKQNKRKRNKVEEWGIKDMQKEQL